MIREEKQLLRARMKDVLRAFGGKEEASRALRGYLLAHPAWQQARVIYGFVPMGSEPGWLDPAWPEGKVLAFPRTGAEGAMEFYRSEEFRVGPWKAHEPVGDEVASPPDLILVPGVAFDRQGRRMGRGGGFYDRWLEKTAGVTKIGLCFSCQVVERVPCEAHDARVDTVITETGVIAA